MILYGVFSLENEHNFVHIIPDKTEMHSRTFPLPFTFLGSCYLINKIVTTYTCRFVTKLKYGINEYPYLYFALRSWTTSTCKLLLHVLNQLYCSHGILTVQCIWILFLCFLRGEL